MDRKHVVAILAEIANGYDDFSDIIDLVRILP